MFAEKNLFLLLKKLKLTRKEFFDFLLLWFLCVLLLLSTVPIAFILVSFFDSNITYESLFFSRLFEICFIPLPVYFGLLIKRYIFVGKTMSPTIFSGKNLAFGIITGLFVGFFMLAFTYFTYSFLPSDRMAKIVQAYSRIGLFYGFIFSLYAGIYEEVLMRFFIMSFFLLLFKKLKKTGIWSAVLLSSGIFVIMHFPQYTILFEVDHVSDLPWLFMTFVTISIGFASLVLSLSINSVEFNA